MQKQCLYVPEKALIKLSSIQKELPAGIKFEYLIYLLHIIQVRPVFNKKIKLGSWIPINGQTLQKFGIRNYKAHFDLLIQLKIIQRDDRYVSGIGSKKYRITGKYISEILRYEVRCKKLQVKIRNNKNRFADDGLGEELNFISKFLSNIVIDASGAQRIIESSNYSLAQKAHFSLNVRMIQNKEWFCKRDSTSFRIHSNLTNMPSILRPFLSYQGKSLVSCDVANCQPFLSIILLNELFYINSDRSNLLTLSNLINYNPNIEKLVSSDITPFMLSILEKSPTDEFRSFIELCSAGKLYDFLKNEISQINVDRNKVKSIMIPLMYEKNEIVFQRLENHEILKLFVRCFPKIHEIFKAFKQKTHKALAILLQSIESFLFIEKVLSRISKERPKLPVFLIHDSILTVNGEEGYVCRIIEEETIKLIGYKPTIKIEQLIKRVEKMPH